MSQTRDRWETHWDAGHNWALVLAAGEGSRLQALTMTASGVAVPKQFCSLGGDTSLLHCAIRRAQAIAPPERTCAVVADHHRRWWQALPLDIPADNLIRQPRNRGTANGILLPLLHIVHRDPDAAVLVLPSDHYVRNESVLASSLRRAMSELQREQGHLILLGIGAGRAGPGARLYRRGRRGRLGYSRRRRVRREAECCLAARALIARGAVWNSFIFAATGRTLLRTFEERCPDLVGEMRHIVDFAGPVRHARCASCGTVRGSCPSWISPATFCNARPRCCES